MNGAIHGAGGLWIVMVLGVHPNWTGTLLLLSPFVLVPLGLKIADAVGPATPLLRILEKAAPATAIPAGMSYVPDPGLGAALLSLPWFGFTILVAVTGVVRLASRRTLGDPAIGADAGLIYLAVGGAWLTLSRAGANPLGFHDAIVELTAVHFHYAGFALPIVASFVCGQLGRSVLVPMAVMIGVPLTALGITAGGAVEWIAATCMALAGLATAARMAGLGRRLAGIDRLLLTAASGSLAAGMGLALGWAWSVQFGWNYLMLEGMARYHGSLNALGFGLVGLIACHRLSAGRRRHEPAGMWLGRPNAEGVERLHSAALGDHAVTARAHRRTHEWQRSVAGAELARAVAGLRNWAGHEAAGVAVFPPRPPIEIGETIVLVIPVGPLSFTATSRIVEVINEPNRFGFTYATLDHHPVAGTETFTVTATEDGVDITVSAQWQPATVATRTTPWLTRLVQRRTIDRYLDGITAAGLPQPQQVR